MYRIYAEDEDVSLNNIKYIFFYNILFEMKICLNIVNLDKKRNVLISFCNTIL